MPAPELENVPLSVTVCPPVRSSVLPAPTLNVLFPVIESPCNTKVPPARPPVGAPPMSKVMFENVSPARLTVNPSGNCGTVYVPPLVTAGIASVPEAKINDSPATRLMVKPVALVSPVSERGCPLPNVTLVKVVS